MHPNWRALASVDFPRKIFLKESEASSSQTSPEEKKIYRISTTESGSEVKEFYQEVIQGADEAPKVPEKSLPVRRIRKSKKPFNRNLFFRAAAGNDVETLREMDFARNLEDRDDFGWSALMMAACEGAEESFRLLLEAGASLKASDGHGNSVESLARKKGHLRLLSVIEELNGPEETSGDQILGVSPHFCEICRTEFTETSRKEHETSTLHQFNRKSCISFQQRFPVSNSNRGCRIMLKQGWNKRDGLGPTGSGRLFPVKTVLRRGRSGFGIEQNPAKVTHFGAGDPAAVAGRHKVRKERTRKEIRTMKGMKSDAEKTVELIEATERVADKILANKEELVELDRRRQANREALRELKKSQDSKHWISIGALLVKLERGRAQEMLERDQRVIEEDIETRRNEQRNLVNELRDLEHLSPAAGFDIKPLDGQELSALQSNLLKFR